MTRRPQSRSILVSHASQLMVSLFFSPPYFAQPKEYDE